MQKEDLKRAFFAEIYCLHASVPYYCHKLKTGWVGYKREYVLESEFADLAGNNATEFLEILTIMYPLDTV